MSRAATFYVQCHLTRGQTQQVAWIPEALACRGQAVRLKDDGAWQDGWRVASVGARAPESYVHLHSHDTGRMRRATDV